MRAAAMEDFIRGNKDAFGNLSSRSVEALLKRVNEASSSDAKLDNTLKYIEDLLSKKEARDEANKRIEIEDQILKVTSKKAILEKGGRGGMKKSVKKGLKTEEGEITDRLLEIGEFVEKGKSEKTPNPEMEKERIDREIESLESGWQNEEVRRKVEELKERLIELNFANLDKLSIN
jgi:hypothetical protein